MTEIDSTKGQTSFSVKSNEQRLKSIDQYGKEKNEKKRLIKDSLNQKTSTQHFKFDSDDEESSPKVFVKSKLKLFDEEDLTNFEENFSKPGGKLRSLQTKFSSTKDPRFQISDNFLDEPKEISFEQEKNKSLSILESMKTKKSSTTMIRFDPSKSEHQIYEVKEKSSNFVEKTAKPKNEPIDDPTRIFQLNAAELKVFFDKSTTESENFQFKFFENEPTERKEISTNFAPKPIVKETRKIFSAQPDDSSSDGEFQTDDESKPNESSTISKTFFFFELDERLNDGLKNFVRTEDLDELERSWPTKRKEIGEALRSKHRKAIQRKEKHRLFNRRRQQKTRSFDKKIDQD